MYIYMLKSTRIYEHTLKSMKTDKNLQKTTEIDKSRDF